MKWNFQVSRKLEWESRSDFKYEFFFSISPTNLGEKCKVFEEWLFLDGWGKMSVEDEWYVGYYSGSVEETTSKNPVPGTNGLSHAALKPICKHFKKEGYPHVI